jgi:hypothetical protein
MALSATASPKIATYHISRDNFVWQLSKKIPIIIGTTNRYICNNPVKIAAEAPSTEVTDEWVQALTALITMISKDGMVAMVPSQEVLEENYNGETSLEIFPIESEEINMNGTTIELYNFACNMMLVPPTPAQEAEFQRTRQYRTPDLMPLSYNVRQALARELDTLIHPKMKGRIVLKNLDEIPLCPACQIPDTAKCSY